MTIEVVVVGEEEGSSIPTIAVTTAVRLATTPTIVRFTRVGEEGGPLVIVAAVEGRDRREDGDLTPEVIPDQEADRGGDDDVVTADHAVAATRDRAVVVLYRGRDLARGNEIHDQLHLIKEEVEASLVHVHHLPVRKGKVSRDRRVEAPDHPVKVMVNN